MMGRIVKGAALALAVALAALRPAAAQEADSADSAWVAGDLETAGRLYADRLAADSTDLRALHRMALLHGWNGRYDESLQLFDRLLALEPAHPAALDRARVLAWRGDHRAALEAVDAIVAREPANRAALEARAQFASWAGLYDQSLRAYGELLEIAPHDPALVQARARVLGWAGRHEAAAAAYREALEAAPGDTAALLGLGQVLAWAGQYDSARVVFRGVLEQDAGNRTARRSLAQVASWSGDLVEGERLWRQALEADSADAAALVGLAATLRWQGRDADALAVLRRAEALHPDNPDVREQLRWVHAATAPRASSHAVYETDSDGNRMGTTTLTGSWRPGSRVEVRVQGYLRQLELQGDPLLQRRAFGGALSLWTQLGLGWGVTGGLGVSHSDAGGREPVLTAQAALSTPGRYPVRGSLSMGRSAFDATAVLAERGVVVNEVNAAFHARPARGWTLTAAAGAAHFDAERDNSRVSGSVGLSRRVARPLTAGVVVRAFSFAHDLDQGYWDPDLYGISELVLNWARDWSRWSVDVDAASGVQRIGRHGVTNASFRASGRLGYSIAPGRQIGISSGYANSGLQQLSPTGGADYRYRAISVFAGWAF